MLKLIPRGPIFHICDEALYADVVRALFSHRRKTVKNCLKSSGGMLKREVLPQEILASRPEELYLEDFATITNTVC